MRAPVQSNRSGSLRKKRVVRCVLQADPGQEYFLYVPRAGGHEAPLLVAVHGISRDAFEQAKSFSSHAEARGVVLIAPCFNEERHSDYQRLGRTGRGDRADVVLDSIVEEVALVTGASSRQIYLFGYSGGAQFAHRYMMAHPHRVARAAIASAGWFTFPNVRKRFPYGIRPSRNLPDVCFDPEEFLRVPTAVFVGGEDVTNDALRRSARVDRQQGVTRVERARNWVEAMRAAARAYRIDPVVTFEEVRGKHSFTQLIEQGQLGERVFNALFGVSSTRTEDGGNGSR